MEITTERELLDALRAAAQPAVHLIRSPGSGRSRLGGWPNLPQGVAWPTWHSKPLTFIAQLSLPELTQFADVTGLPRTGCLFFFYDADANTWGFDPMDRGSWQVVYSEQPMPEASVETPQGPCSGWVFKPVPLQAKQILTFPTSERLPVDLSSVPTFAFESEYELRTQAFGLHPAHQIGGLPMPVQTDGMELECQLVSHGLYCGDSRGYEDPRAQELGPGACDWRLLLQVDTDDDAEMMWGDSGRLYFWIRKADLNAKDFSNVWMVLQCS